MQMRLIRIRNGVGKKMAISAGEGIVSEGDQSEQNNRG